RPGSDVPRALPSFPTRRSSDLVLLGADGWVAGLVNAFPSENQLLWDLATRGDYAAARKVYRWYTPLLHLDTHVKLVQYIKLAVQDRKSTRLNSSHQIISYAVFC